jgi:hypothetical protein
MDIELLGVTMKKMNTLECSWCGDEGCGFISVKIDKENNVVTWKDFYLEPEMKKINIGPFYFEWDNYKKVINSTFGTAGIQ